MKQLLIALLGAFALNAQASGWEYTFTTDNFFAVNTEYSPPAVPCTYCYPYVGFGLDENVSFSIKTFEPLAIGTYSWDQYKWMHLSISFDSPFQNKTYQHLVSGYSSWSRYIGYTAKINIIELDAAGLPSKWNIDLNFVQGSAASAEDESIRVVSSDTGTTFTNSYSYRYYDDYNGWYSFKREGFADDGFWSVRQIAAVPEPSTYAMLGLGLGLMGVAARRRKTA